MPLDALPVNGQKAKQRTPYGGLFPVSEVEGPFTTIQAAIDAAVAAGHDASDPALVQVYPGIYTEDLTLEPGIDVAAADPGFRATAGGGPRGTQLRGNITFAGADTGGRATNRCLVSGLDVFEDSGGVAAITFAGTETAQLTLRNMTVAGLSGAGNLALDVDNDFKAGANPLVPGVLQCDNVSLAVIGDSPVVSVKRGQFLASDVSVFAATTDAIDVDGPDSLLTLLHGTFVFGRIEFKPGSSDGETHTIDRSVVQESLPAVPIVVDDGLVQITNTTLFTSVAGAAIGGAVVPPGGVTWSDIVFVGSGSGFGAGLPHAQLVSSPSNRNIIALATGAISARPNEMTLVNATAGAATVTLPAPGTTALTGVIQEVKEDTGTRGAPLTNPVTIVSGGGALIDGSASYSLQNHGDGVRFMTDGTAWYIAPRGNPDACSYVQIDQAAAAADVVTDLFDLAADTDAVIIRTEVTGRTAGTDDAVITADVGGTFRRQDSLGAFPANIAVQNLINTKSIGGAYTTPDVAIGAGSVANQVGITLTSDPALAIAWTIKVKEVRALR